MCYTNLSNQFSVLQIHNLMEEVLQISLATFAIMEAYEFKQLQNVKAKKEKENSDRSVIEFPHWILRGLGNLVF